MHKRKIFIDTCKLANENILKSAYVLLWNRKPSNLYDLLYTFVIETFRLTVKVI